MACTRKNRMPNGKIITIDPDEVACFPSGLKNWNEERIFEEHRKRIKQAPGFEIGKAPRSYVVHDETSYEDELVPFWTKKWGAQGIGKLKEVLLCPPSLNEDYEVWYEDPLSGSIPVSVEGWTARPDMKKWQEQYQELVRAYEQNGVVVHQFRIPEPAMGPYGLLRAIWAAADVALVINGGAIIPREGLTSVIKGRNQVYRKALDALNVPIIYQMRGKAVSETGGCVWLDDKHFVAEDGMVMNREGLKQLKMIFALSNAKLIVTQTTGVYDNVKFPAGGTSHTDMIVGFPDANVAVLSPWMVGYPFVKFLKRIKFDIIEVPPEEYHTCVYNMVPIEPGKVICPAGAPYTIKEMEKRGIDVIALPYTESAKVGGAIHCSTCQLVREPGPLVEELVKTPLEEIAPELTMPPVCW